MSQFSIMGTNLKKFGNFNPQKIKFVNIVTFGKASSAFLQGLLDKHPEIVTLIGPVDIRDIDCEKSEESILNKMYQQLVETSKKWISQDFRFDDRFSLKRCKKYFNEYIFNFGLTPKTALIALHYAYAISNGLNMNKIKYIVIQSHDFNSLIESLKVLPCQKIIFTVRDPRSNYWSAKRKTNVIGSAFLQYFTFELYKKVKKKNSILILKHEDLHSDYKKVKESLIDFLKIKLSKSMDSSTFFGKPFYGTQGDNSSSTGISSNKPNKEFASDKWKKDLSTMEIKDIELIFSIMMKEFNYERLTDYEPITINFFDTKYYFLSSDYISNKKNPMRFALQTLKRIFFIPFIGNLIIKSFMLTIIPFVFIYKKFKIKSIQI